jgi:hypothetical protein
VEHEESKLALNASASTTRVRCAKQCART